MTTFAALVAIMTVLGIIVSGIQIWMFGENPFDFDDDEVQAACCASWRCDGIVELTPADDGIIQLSNPETPQL
jgi:hypothetical protein